MTALAQRSFAGGEIAPALYARTDQTKYATGLRVCRNFFVQRHGGVANRPGTQFIAEAKNSSAAIRLIKFVYNAASNNAYVIEMGDRYMRFYQLGGQVAVSGVGAWVDATVYAAGALVSYSGVNYYCTLAHTSATATDRPSTGSAWQSVWYALDGTIFEIPTPYRTADLPTIQYVQSGDVVTLVHPSYPVRELKRYSHTKWTLTAIPFGPSIDPPTNLALSGGGAGTVRYWAITAVKEGSNEESLIAVVSAVNEVPAAGTPVTITWSPSPGAGSYNVYRSTDGVTFGFINSSGGSGMDQSDSAWTDSNEVASTGTVNAWVAAAAQCRNPLAAIAATPNLKAYDGLYAFKLLTTLTCAAGTGVPITEGRVAFYYKRNTDAVRQFFGYMDISPVGGFTSSGAVEQNFTVFVPDDGYNTLQFDLVPEVHGAAEDGYADPVGATFSLTVDTATAATGVVTWRSGSSGFVDVGVAPDYTSGPPAQPATFASVDRYPASVTYYSERQIFANTNAEPEKVFGSRVASYKNFAISTPLQDDDAVTFGLAGRRVNAVKHMIDLGRLIIFTAGEEKLVGGDDAGILRPDAINPTKLSAHGSGDLRPLEIDDSAIYLQGRGTHVRDLKPIDADSYQGTDLTVFAAHLFDGYTLVDWDYAEIPNSIVWAVRSDGKLLGLTYLREHAVWGWHRHDTDGVIENICVIPEGSEDRIYLLVKRTINGQTKRYIERMASRFFTEQADGFFVDSGLTYNGWNTTVKTLTISGGSAWDDTEELTLTASAATFVAGDVGNVFIIVLEDADGNETARIRMKIESYTSTTVVTARSTGDIPAGLQAVAQPTWARAVDTVSGLDHLEGKEVSVLGDGAVVASPNNSDYDPAPVVTGGTITLDECFAVIHVGLPYTSDLETLDIDSAGQATVKDRKLLVNRVGLFLEATRGIWAGLPDQPTNDDLLNGLQELKLREDEDYGATVSPLTDSVEVNIETKWSNGRCLIRQVDPLPATILSVTPMGKIPS